MNKAGMMALGAVVAVANFGGAHAATKCNVVGTWQEVVEGANQTPFTMSTNKAGVAKGANQLCPGSKSTKITTTSLTATGWNFNASSKNCSEVVSAATTWNSGSTCATVSGSSASGTLTIPGYGTFPITVTKE